MHGICPKRPGLAEVAWIWLISLSSIQCSPGCRGSAGMCVNLIFSDPACAAAARSIILPALHQAMGCCISRPRRSLQRRLLTLAACRRLGLRRRRWRRRARARQAAVARGPCGRAGPQGWAFAPVDARAGGCESMMARGYGKPFGRPRAGGAAGPSGAPTGQAPHRPSRGRLRLMHPMASRTACGAGGACARVRGLARVRGARACGARVCRRTAKAVLLLLLQKVHPACAGVCVRVSVCLGVCLSAHLCVCAPCWPPTRDRVASLPPPPALSPWTPVLASHGRAREDVETIGNRTSLD